ncbi:MAG TPA: alpha/beta fold hydrolase [Enteractinococcus helveticum]|uniref:Alpha/beta fold hydrolase n=1 Tax=Enteractinococcus helveticum TaxID=1837282 RepID=A0A921FN22_9MICC|nr:alpha/beta fold hydrolase [Enteractinococcus helveticum]HJF14860.1 alpha/beta fold hydrolase [Enteractinococcus helveticum]
MMQSIEILQPDPQGVLAKNQTHWGIVLLHGFTADPGSVLPWGQALATAGATVYIPTLPGHGTTVSDLAQTRAGQWRQQVQQTVDNMLMQNYDHIAVAGLSLGGTLALDAAAHRMVDATFLVNPALTFKPVDQLGVALSPLFQRIIPTVGPLAGDIQKAGVVEEAYDRTPVPAVVELAKLFRTVRRQLTDIQSPVTLYCSTEDHIVPPTTAKLLRRRLGPNLLRIVRMDNSYHVATLDNDAPLIFQDSVHTLLKLSGGGRSGTA